MKITKGEIKIMGVTLAIVAMLLLVGVTVSQWNVATRLRSAWTRQMVAVLPARATPNNSELPISKGLNLTPQQRRASQLYDERKLLAAQAPVEHQAMQLLHQRRYQEAKALCQKATKIRHKHSVQGGVYYCRALGIISRVYRKQGQQLKADYFMALAKSSPSSIGWTDCFKRGESSY